MLNKKNNLTFSLFAQKINLLYVVFFIITALFTSIAAGLIHTSGYASAAACTVDELKGNDYKYTTTAGSGNISEVTKGKYTVPPPANSGGRTEASCKDTPAKGITDNFVQDKTDKQLYRSTPESSTTCPSIITLMATPTSGTKTVAGFFQDRSGVNNSKSASEGCKDEGSKRSISVTVTGSTGAADGACKDKYYARAGTGYITQEACGTDSQVLVTRNFEIAQSGKGLIYTSLTGSGSARSACAAGGYNGRINLSEKITDKSGDVTGTIQKLKSSGGRSCANDGSAIKITVSVKNTDCSKLGDYETVGCSYAAKVCEALGDGYLSEDQSDICFSAAISEFEKTVKDCTAENEEQDAIIACIADKSPEVASELNAMLSTASKTTCAIAQIGWIVCPVVNFMAGIADGAFGFLADSFLKTDPQLLNTKSTTYEAWSIMRTIANVAFVIVFIIIIFSQLTSVGISNYGVKKMMPRIVVAAILVNISYFLCQAAVDISNILGYSLKDVFGSITDTVSRGESAKDALGNITPFANGEGFAGAAGAVLAIGIIGVGFYALLSTLIPVLLAAVIALVMILFILIARQAIIILLVIISPLAFVAYLLPNTESLFKKWRQTLTTMLLLFPIVAVVFGAATLASQLLGSTFNGGIEGDDENLFGQIAAAAVLVLPLFFVPALLKKSLDGIGNLGSTLNNLSNKAGNAAGKAGGKAYGNSRLGKFQDYRSTQKDIRRAAIQSGTFEGKYGKYDPRRLRNAASVGNRLVNRKSGTFGSRLAAAGVNLEAAELEKDRKAAATLIAAKPPSFKEARKELREAKDPARRQAYIDRIVSTNDIAGINEMIEQSHDWSEQDRVHLSNSLASSGSRPNYIGQATLAAIREGKKTVDSNGKTSGLKVRELVKGAVLANAYSAEKVAIGDADELTFVANEASQIGDPTITASLKKAADTASKDARLNVRIGKNKEQIENLRNERAPTTEQLAKVYVQDAD